MMNNTYFIEVNSILNKMNPKEISEIPKDIIEIIRKKANNQQINIDSNKRIEEQISNEALSILTYIVLKYTGNNEQKIQLKNTLIQNQMEYNQKQMPIKDVNEIFRSKQQTKELCVIEKESFIKRIMKKILEYFKKK